LWAVIFSSTDSAAFLNLSLIQTIKEKKEKAELAHIEEKAYVIFS